MKKIIYRKLAKDCTIFFFLNIFTISIIIWVLQAVNYLDFVIEDGHGFFVYFNYTLLSFPKIFSRIYPFAIFLAFSYILLKHEEKNELLIFWNFGIKKIDFINFFIKLSLLFVSLSLLLNVVIVPFAQDKARSFIRTSDLNFFESILKPKKFIDAFQNLTIYFDERDINGDFNNIFLNDKVNENDRQTTFAKKGVFEIRGEKRMLVLYDGKTINSINGKITEFTFSKTDFNISKFSSTTVTQKKIQETSTNMLISCVMINEKFIKNLKNKIIVNCSTGNMSNIYAELYSRIIKPLYVTLLVTIALLIILKSKSDAGFKFYKFKIYSLGFLFIIFLESSSNFINASLVKNLFISALPFFFLLAIYLYFLKILKVNKV